MKTKPLVSAYRAILRATHNHGMRTLARWNVRAFPDGQQITLDSGLPLWIPPDPHFFGFLLGRHEQHLADVMREQIQPGDCCVDVGANIGYFSCLMSGWCGATGSVLAYEPEQHNFDILSTNADLARRNHRTVIPVRAAVSAYRGELHLVQSALSTHHQVTMTDPSSTSRTVPSIVLDEDLAARGFDGLIRVVKIDVEGHEVHVLHGCRELVREGRIGCMLIEVFPGDHARQVDEILRGWNVRAKVWLNGSWRDMPVSAIPYCTDIVVVF
jgi:FkbM family methyltransferase